MKKSLLGLLILGFAILNFGCQQSKDQNTTPVLANDCINYPQSCNPQLYNQNTGFVPYNYGSGYVYAGNGITTSGATPFYMANSAAYLCNCPFGTVPTYNTYSGLGCVQSQYVGSGYVAFGWGPNNGQWLNIPQISNMSGYPNSSCYNGVIQSCVVGATNSCTAGYTCRYGSAASSLGICQKN